MMEEGETAIFDLTTKTPNTTSDIMVNVNVVQSSGGGDFWTQEMLPRVLLHY